MGVRLSRASRQVNRQFARFVDRQRQLIAELLLLSGQSVFQAFHFVRVLGIVGQIRDFMRIPGQVKQLHVIERG